MMRNEFIAIEVCQVVLKANKTPVDIPLFGIIGEGLSWTWYVVCPGYVFVAI